MKKKGFYLLALICSIGLLTACGSDDDVKYPVDNELAGSYSGKMDVHYEGVPAPIASGLVQKVYISKASDTEIKLELKNFSINVTGTVVPIGDISIDRCALKPSGDKYQFTGNQTLNLSVGECKTSVSGTIGKGAVDLVIRVDVNKGKMKVKVDYKGDRLIGDENVKFYGFENWTTDLSQSVVANQYPVIGSDYKNPEWATCNQAVMLVKTMGALGGINYTGGWAVNPTGGMTPGTKAIEMISLDTKGGSIFGQKVPKVTAATAFLGSFNAMAAMTNPMATTSFGIPYTEKPLTVKGFYSYAPGSEFYNEKGNLDPSGKDACAMTTVLYEVNDYKETLDGSTIYNSKKIVARAMYSSGTKTSGFVPFELSLKYEQPYDAAKKYKFAIIFSSSKDGAAYKAAVGSRLLIDNVTIVNEK